MHGRTRRSRERARNPRAKRRLARSAFTDAVAAAVPGSQVVVALADELELPINSLAPSAASGACAAPGGSSIPGRAVLEHHDALDAALVDPRESEGVAGAFVLQDSVRHVDERLRAAHVGRIDGTPP